jgi:DNA mismatch repair ATPase MutS
VANALAQSVDHVLSFLMMLRAELGFYVGCLNLCDRLAAKGEPFCFPVAAAPAKRLLSFRGLYDPCLSLQLEERVVGNDAHADGKSLIVVTGANRGGKSTFLRSLGLAQLMMQAGMVVPAIEYTSSICGAMFTHFKREEDVTMTSGKLDEELRRMSEIADRVAPGDIVLLNESLAATNEREGSQIASQVITALVDSGIKVWVVTHLYELARGLHEKRDQSFLFLRAERRPDGVRTFRITEGEPLPTSYGRDLYERVLGAKAESVAPGAAQVPAEQPDILGTDTGEVSPVLALPGDIPPD